MLCSPVSLFSKIFVSWSMPSCLSPSHALGMKPSVQAGDLSSLITIIRHPIHCPTLILIPCCSIQKWMGAWNLISLLDLVSFHTSVSRFLIWEVFNNHVQVGIFCDLEDFKLYVIFRQNYASSKMSEQWVICVLCNKL